MLQKCIQLFDMQGHPLNRLNLEAVFFVKADKNIMVSFGKVIDDTVDVRFDIFRAVQVQMLVC